jgi:hypothetical protein
MSTSEGPLARAYSSFSKLQLVASNLNQVSDGLRDAVAQIDVAIKDLNLGCSVWVIVTHHSDPDTEFFRNEDLGYAKVGGKWGIALRTVSGRLGDESEDVEQWLFNDAPRSLRISGIEKLPQLLERLAEDATAAAEKVRGSLAVAQDFVAAISTARAEPSKPEEEPRRVIRHAVKKGGPK